MAETIKSSELLDTAGITNDLSRINIELKEMINSLDVQLRKSIPVLNQLKVNNSQSIKDMNQAMKESNALLQQQIKLEQLQFQTEKELIKIATEQQKLEREQIKTKQALLAEEKKATAAKEKANKEREKANDLYSKESKRLNDLRKEYRNLVLTEGEATEKTKKLGLEIQSLDAKLKKVDASVGQFQRNVGNYPKQGFFSQVGAFFTGNVLAQGASKLVGVFKDAITVSRDFEKSLANLSAITGASGKDLGFYKEQAKQLGLTTQGGAKAVVEAFKLIGSAKPELLQNKEALAGVTKQAILLSKAAGLELPDAATRLTDALNQFGAPAEQAGKFVDILASGAKAGAAEVPEITDALLKFGVAAKSSNISIQESVGAIELLAEKGLKGAEAGTALRNVFSKLSASKILPPEAQKELAKAGVDIKKLSDNSLPLSARLKELSKIQGNASAITRVFGLENKIAGEVLISNIPRLNELTAAVNENGVATQQAATNTDTFDQAMVEAGNAYDNLLLQITDGDFGALIKGFVKVATEELNKFTKQLNFIGKNFNNGIGATARDEAFNRNTQAQLKNYALLTEANKKVYVEKLKQDIKAELALVEIEKNAGRHNKRLTTDELLALQERTEAKLRILQALEVKTVKGSENTINEQVDNDIKGNEKRNKIARDAYEKKIKAEEDYRQKLKELQEKEDREMEELNNKIKEDLKKTFAAREGIRQENFNLELENSIARYEKEKEIGSIADKDELDRLKKLLEEANQIRKQALKDKYEYDVNQEGLNNAQKLEITNKYNNDVLRLDTDLNKSKEELEAESRKKQEEEDKISLEKRKEAMFDYLNKSLDMVEKEIQRENDLKQKALDDEISRREKSIAIQQSLAERGQKNTLAEEEAELAKSQQKKEDLKKQQIKQEKTLAFLKLLAGYAEKDPSSALQKALVDTALSSVITAAFIDGTENVGNDPQFTKNKISNGTDGYVARFDGDERILNPEQNKMVGNLSNEELALLARNYNNGNYLPNYAMGLNVEPSTANNIYQSAQLNQLITLNKKIENLESVIKSKPVNTTNIDNLGNVINSELKNGFKQNRIIMKKPLKI